MIQRMLEEMEEGLNPDITVVARYQEGWKGESIVQEEETNKIQLQIDDNIIYASVKDLYDVEMEMMKKVGHINPDNRMGFQWWPVQQGIVVLNVTVYDYYNYGFQMGSTKYYWLGFDNEEVYCAPARALYGELMIPVCDLSHYDREPQDEWKGGWVPETNTLTLSMLYQSPRDWP